MESTNEDSKINTGAYVAVGAAGAAAGAATAGAGVQAFYTNPTNLIRDTVGKFTQKVTGPAEVEKVLHGVVARFKANVPTLEYFEESLKFVRSNNAHIPEPVADLVRGIYTHENQAIPKVARMVSERAKELQKHPDLGKFLKPSFIGHIPGGGKTIAATGAAAGMGTAIYILKSVESAIQGKQSFAEKVSQAPANQGPQV